MNAATDPTVQQNVTAEQTKINNKLSPFKYYLPGDFLRLRLSLLALSLRSRMQPAARLNRGIENFVEVSENKKAGLSDSDRPFLI